PWVQFPLQENVSPLGEGCARALLSPSSFDTPTRAQPKSHSLGKLPVLVRGSALVRTSATMSPVGT
ncbi:hypothetical protein PLICRDRAFT_676977, partial [Plicaturopsis crispa FD-325 SS-3]